MPSPSSEHPLVSVVTPTWERPALLRACIQNVAAQTYRPLEHVVVSDGEDEAAWRASTPVAASGVPVQIVELGRNWSGLDPTSFGIAPLTVGYLVASGDYIVNLSDDDRMAPDYISRLVALLESSGADFAYSKARFYWHDQTPDEGVDIGSDPPRHGQITSFLFRADCLYRFGMPRYKTHPVDWSLVSDWMRMGARWAYLPEVLFWHRADEESGRAR